MRKWTIAIIVLALMVCGGSVLETSIPAYRTFDTLVDASNAVDSDLAAATGFGIGAVTGEIDLATVAGVGKGVSANSIVLTLHAATAADGDTLTQKIYGRSENGPPQLIASIVWTIGTARADGSTATLLWADTAAVTDTHLTTIATADGAGSNRVVSVWVDLTGYRFLTSLITAQTGDPTTITVFYRYF
ncbi:hypothetical protein LCGC14_2244790 [marine sediment metagenome]|uniref:Uncharacterized protein n=1 Tax=marine sediment metagenome TaxID=412755 RepID=A0A0F9FGX1_9ZZZZ|nr:hypothetical protein [Phycisphaerales bacterium]